MALMVDADVFIHFERRGVPVDLSVWEPSEGVFISVVTVSELLRGKEEKGKGDILLFRTMAIAGRKKSSEK